MSVCFCAFSRTSEHNRKISANSPHMEFFSSFVFAMVICSAEKSNISSDKSRRMTMLFSHSGMLVLDEVTISGMNVGQL